MVSTIRQALTALATLLLLTSSSVQATFKKCNGRAGKRVCRALQKLGLPTPKCCKKNNVAPTAVIPKTPTKAPLAVAPKTPMAVAPTSTDPNVPRPPTVRPPTRAPTASARSGCLQNALVHGDPHVTTFDKLYYSCQGRGEFILLDAPASGARIHARFEKKNALVSLATGVVAKGDRNAPTVEISIPKIGADAVQLLVDGVKVPNAMSGFTNSLVQVTQSSNVYTIFFTTSGLSILVRYIPLSFKHLSITVQRPCPTTNDTIRGLLGSPDDVPLNDWTTKTGTPIVIPTGDLHGRAGYDYCVQNWCVSNATESIFALDGVNPFSSYFGYNETFSGNVNTSQAASAIQALCGTNVPCLIDGIELGEEGSRNVLTTEADLARLVSSARFQAWPSLVLVNQSTIVSLTVNLTGVITAATGIEEFLVFRVDPVTRVVGTQPIVSLNDVGSGAGNDTTAGDFVFSAVIAVRSTMAGESFSFRAVPVIGGVRESASPFALTALNAVRSYSIQSGLVDVVPVNSTFPLNLQASTVDGLVLVIEYSWPADKRDLDTGTFFLGAGVGFSCGAKRPYMNFTGDDTGLGGKETVTIELGKAANDGNWTTSTFVDLNAGWYRPPDRGPASISMFTRQDFPDGTKVNGNNLVSFVVDPGVQSGCASTKVAVARVTRASGGQIQIQVTAS
jgi:von Willebrand factor type D domain